MRKITFVLLAVWMLHAAHVQACSLCGSTSRSNSLAFEFEHATVIAYGYLANPMFTNKSGGGTTEFHVEKILKDDPAFPRQKVVTVTRYLPVLDAKSPPKFVMFFRSPKESTQPYWGKEIAAPAVLEFVSELQRLSKEPEKRLIYAGKHLDHADQLIADEAFLVFAKADDKLIAEHAKKLDPARLRKLVKDPEIEAERLSMFAYLLGACGNAEDADLLRSLVVNPQRRHYKSYEGILAGYITMRPKDGWAIVQDMLASEKRDFMLRYATLRTMRFCYNSHPDENGPNVMKGLAQAIGHPDIADIAIQDLRKWQRWEHTPLVLSCWDKKSHRSAIIKQSLVRYALACPQPDARKFLERARQQDPELVKDIEAESK